MNTVITKNYKKEHIILLQHKIHDDYHVSVTTIVEFASNSYMNLSIFAFIFCIVYTEDDLTIKSTITSI